MIYEFLASISFGTENDELVEIHMHA